MREIKFRAWDGEKIILDGETLIRSNEWWYGKPNENGLPLGSFSGIDGHVLMQYTGLKDKNGKEIYEGDILKSAGIVAWNDTEVRWSCIDISWNDRREWHDMLYLTTPLEVIGNIYENPELL